MASLAEDRKSQEMRLDKKEKLLYILQAVFLILLLAELFFSSLLASFFLLPLGWIFYKKQLEEAKRKREERKKEEFREILLGVSSALSAGYSMDNAWRNVLLDYGNNKEISDEMRKELERIRKGLEMNKSLELLLQEFAERIELEDAKSFCDIYRFARYSGGNMNNIIHTTISRIEDKMEVEREIVSVTAARRMEAKIMNLIPVLILAYLRLASPGYLEPLYHNLAGVILMGICLVIYAAAYSLAERMVVIEV